jgi:molybdate transport system substrate-binding protein
MAVPGIDLVGPLPDDIQLVTVTCTGIISGTKQAEAARAFIDFLASPAAAQVIRAKGLEPVT